VGLALALYVSALNAGQVPARRTRTIPFSGKPVAESLLPDDDIVEIAPFGEALGRYDEPPRVLFERGVQRAAMIVEVDVTVVSGVLADEGMFVRTRFVGQVREVIAARNVKPGDGISVGQPLEFSVGGGEVAIRGVVVRTVLRADYPFPAQYVVVLDHKAQENGWSVGLSPPLLIAGDKASPVAPAKSIIGGLSLREMREIAKAAK